MPQEVIFDQDEKDGFVVRVGWTPEKSVEVATTTRGRSIAQVLYGGSQDHLLQLGSKVRSLLDEEEPGRSAQDSDIALGDEILTYLTERHGTGHPYDGLFVHLDRRGCNRLIKMLRKARDAAYERDA